MSAQLRERRCPAWRQDPPGQSRLRTALVDAANSVFRTKTYLGAQYRHLAARRGAKRAFVAVDRTILGVVYAVLEALGYVVTVEPRAA